MVAGNDDICACCPKVETNDCRDEFPAAIDERLLERLRIPVDCVYDVKELNDLIMREIAPHDLSDNCRGCPWLESGWCAEGLGRHIQR